LSWWAEHTQEQKNKSENFLREKVQGNGAAVRGRETSPFKTFSITYLSLFLVGKKRALKVTKKH
jgi:hypothetical protein